MSFLIFVPFNFQVHPFSLVRLSSSSQHICFSFFFIRCRTVKCNMAYRPICWINIRLCWYKNLFAHYNNLKSPTYFHCYRVTAGTCNKFFIHAINLTWFLRSLFRKFKINIYCFDLYIAIKLLLFFWTVTIRRILILFCIYHLRWSQSHSISICTYVWLAVYNNIFLWHNVSILTCVGLNTNVNRRYFFFNDCWFQRIMASIHYSHPAIPRFNAKYLSLSFSILRINYCL